MMANGTQLLMEGWPVMERWPVVLSSLLACVVVLLTAAVFPRSPVSDIPLVGAELGDEQKRKQAYNDSAKHLYKSGYRKFRDRVFEITTPGKSRTMVVPRKYLDELRKLPVDVLSLLGATAETAHGRYTGVSPADEKLTGPDMIPFLALPAMIKTALTPALSRLSSVLNATSDEAISVEFPPCDDWTAVKIMPVLQRMVAMISGRVFIGPELFRNEAWMHSSIHYTFDVMAVIDAINRMPKWRRAWSVSRLPEVRELERHREQAYAFLLPVVEARKAMHVKPDDMLSWMMDRMDKHGRGDNSTRTLVKLQMFLSFAAILTTSVTAANAFHTLAVMPDVAAELRAEARNALAEHDGVFTAAAVHGMKKLDSFLKEDMRCHSMFATTFNRKVLKSFTLSDGTTFPAGVIIEAVGLGTLFDDGEFEDAEKFDAFRFYRLRERQREGGHADPTGQAQFVSVTQNSLVFGYGRNACPGRFFAANELKVIVAKMLLRYHVGTMDGRKERYPNVEKGGSSQPDPERVLMFKKI